MVLVVDLSTGDVSMRDADNFRQFSVVAIPQWDGDGEDNGALGAIAAALSVHDIGSVDPSGDVLVSVEAVTRLAAESAAATGVPLGPGWATGFAGMLEYAATKGWIADDGSIRAHVEWAP